MRRARALIRVDDEHVRELGHPDVVTNDDTTVRYPARRKVSTRTRSQRPRVPTGG